VLYVHRGILHFFCIIGKKATVMLYFASLFLHDNIATEMLYIESIGGILKSRRPGRSWIRRRVLGVRVLQLVLGDLRVLRLEVGVVS